LGGVIYEEMEKKGGRKEKGKEEKKKREQDPPLAPVDKFRSNPRFQLLA